VILLWGLEEDSTFRSVHDCLRRWNARLAFVNHASIAHTRAEFRSDPAPSYLLHCDEGTLNLDSFSAAYLRPYDHRLYGKNSGKETNRESITGPDLVHHLVTSWAEHSSGLIINRPSAEATNQSKLYQSIFINDGGFRVPDSLISNDHDAILDFAARHGQVIYKSMSSVRSIVQTLDTATLKDLGAMGPALFQQRVLGRNVRVHVIGGETVACAIDTEGIDYRYAPSEMKPFELTADVARRCVALSRKLGLVLSGIDLILTPQGEYYCLEANPSPAFSCFDITPGRSIARLVAERLLDAAPANLSAMTRAFTSS
jgi:RimK-like ATP-grasp domain